MLERMFKLRERNTDLRTEVVAGVTTFATMAYILFLNPFILSKAGMSPPAVLVATALAAGFGSILMGILADLPFAMAPGMGMNAYFAFTVVGQMKIPWQTALAAVFLDGCIFLAISLLPLREKMIKDIPYNIKLASSAAIGLFITLIGLKNVGIVASSPDTLVRMGSILEPAVLLTLLATLVGALTIHFKIRGGLLMTLLGTTVIGLAVPNGQGGNVTTWVPLAQWEWPSWELFRQGAFQLDFQGAGQLGLAMIVFTFTFVSLFDTAGTFVGLATKLGWINSEQQTFKGANRGLLAESFAIMFGALMGTSTTTTYIESAAGIAEGGRTGLTSVVTGLCFIFSLFLAPLATMIPAQATSPILILVGFLMLDSVIKLDLEDVTEALPAFLTLVMVPFTYNVANGLIFGILSYIGLKTLSGRVKEVGVTMWVLGVMCCISLTRGH
jgi:adenine/guanine/hypoxanthine permease